jgi:outer membrane protein
MATALWWCVAAAGPVLAQSPPVAPQGSGDALPFDIPAQSMAAALNAWAVQANAQVFVDPGPVAHVRAPAIHGVYTPRQALRALLARSNLQVAQGADGVFVIKPRSPTVAARPAAAPAELPEAATPASAAPPGPPQARAAPGPWLLRVAADFALDDAATGGASAALGGDYFITDHLAASIGITAPRTHTFTVPAGPSTPGYRGSARLVSSSLSLQYHLAPEGRLRPYVGAGIDVTALYDATGGAGLDRASVGPMAQAGLDVQLGPHWMLGAAVSWAQVRPRTTGAPVYDIRIDPVQFDLGVAYRFVNGR